MWVYGNHLNIPREIKKIYRVTLFFTKFYFLSSPASARKIYELQVSVDTHFGMV